MRVLWAGLLAAILMTTSVSGAEFARARPAAQMPGGIPAFTWTLVSFPGVGEIAEPRYSVQFLADGTVAIGADCNRAVGTWSGGDGVLDITLGLQTLAACEEGSLEQPYLAALDGVTGYNLSGATLVLYGAAGELVFTI